MKNQVAARKNPLQIAIKRSTVNLSPTVHLSFVQDNDFVTCTCQLDDK
jgi:hypothetical protein